MIIHDASKIVNSIPNKTRLLSPLIPGNLSTYIYNNEVDYYNNYKESYFGMTFRKGGWDCMRHYEILANNCIPYFINLDECPEYTLTNLPKELLLKARELANNFDEQKYFSILDELFNYTKNNLTTKKLAQYILNYVYIPFF